MRQLSRDEMKKVNGGNKPIPPGCQCLAAGAYQTCPYTGKGYPEYCTAAQPYLDCCTN